MLELGPFGELFRKVEAAAAEIEVYRAMQGAGSPRVALLAMLALADVHEGLLDVATSPKKVDQDALVEVIAGLGEMIDQTLPAGLWSATLAYRKLLQEQKREQNKPVN